jgi:hypothetical protein
MESASAGGKRLFVIYFPDGYLGVAPTVSGFLGELTAAGHYVHVRGLATAYPSAGTLHESSRIVTFARLFDTPRAVWFRRGLLKIKLLSFLELAWFACQNFQLDRDIPLAQRRLRRVNIGIDLQGTVLAWCHALYARSSYVSVSLELPSANYRWFEKLVSWLERSSLRNAAALVIQDADRLKTLGAYRSPLPSRVFYLPNSSGPRDSRATPTSPNNYLRRTLNIDQARFPNIALHAGMIQDEVYAQELAKAFNQIDCGFALVFHERVKRSMTQPYIQLLRSHNSKNLFLSLEPVPLDRVDAIFAAATVGLVFYRPIDDNFAQIASASGKLSFNLKHGIPVLMNALPSLVAMNQRYDFGAVVQNPEDSGELSAALVKIMSRYDFYSSNARRCFQEEFDFEMKFRPVRKMLESL